MPYGWYTSPLYEKPQFKNLINQISSVTGEKHAKEAADAINKYMSVPCCPRCLSDESLDFQLVLTK
jgi:hypothetical protein